MVRYLHFMVNLWRMHTSTVFLTSICTTRLFLGLQCKTLKSDGRKSCCAIRIQSIANYVSSFTFDVVFWQYSEWYSSPRMCIGAIDRCYLLSCIQVRNPSRMYGVGFTYSFSSRSVVQPH